MDKRILLIGANGYVGSAIQHYLETKGIEICGVDNLLRAATPLRKDTIITSYQNLSLDFLDGFDICLWFAGHSSVQQCLNDQAAAQTNNLIDLVQFRNKFRGLLIYASSASVYSGVSGGCSEQSPTTPPKNIYDYTKVTFDNYLNAVQNDKFIGLRMGTVNGLMFSKKEANHLGPQSRTRWELIVNSMVKSSHQNGYLTVANEECNRSILDINDLVTVIHNLIIDPPESGIYNLYSFNANIGEIGRKIGEITNSEVQSSSNATGTYSFSMDRKKIESHFPRLDFKNLEAVVENILSGLAQK